MEAISKQKTVEDRESAIMNSDEINKILSAFGVELEEIRWREDDNGVLYAGDSISPDLLARIEFFGDSNCNAAVADESEVGIMWENLSRVRMFE